MDRQEFEKLILIKNDYVLENPNMEVSNLVAERVTFKDFGKKIEVTFLGEFVEIIPYERRDDWIEIFHLSENSKCLKESSALLRFLLRTFLGWITKEVRKPFFIITKSVISEFEIFSPDWVYENRVTFRNKRNDRIIFFEQLISEGYRVEQYERDIHDSNKKRWKGRKSLDFLYGNNSDIEKSVSLFLRSSCIGFLKAGYRKLPPKKVLLFPENI